MNKIIIIIILLLAFTAVLATALSYAMDYPHNASKSVGCEDCHYIWGSEPSLMIEGLSYGNNIDDTQYNALCWSCHQPLDATPVETHSSLQIDNGYGDWSFECIECHDVHGNYQFRTYGASSYIAQDTVAAVNATTLTRTAITPVWANDQFQGMVLVPNIAYDSNNYLITGNDNATITVEGTIDLSKVTALVDTFAVVYSNMVKSTIATPNSGIKTVKLFNSTGPNSFADGDTTYEGVCEVCHTQTTYHRNDASGNHDHNKGLDCMTCHQHTKGFSAACDTCHGNPPVVNTATGGPDGLVNDPGVTGSTTAGAHDLHVNTKSYDCAVCHYDSVGTGATHNNGLAVTMGFYLFGGAEQGGSYDGQSAVSYNATTTSPVTSVSSNNNKTCSNIYCHSTGQSTVSGSSSTPTYASPVWDDPVSGDCGTCHKVEEISGLSSGSHEAHLETTGVSGCAECHTGAENDASAYNSSNHVNNSIDVANSYDAGGLPGNGYGKCSTGRCHDDGLGNSKLTPQWGNPGGGCSECHLGPPATGSHIKHVTTTNYNTAECGDCHDGADINTAPAQHLDGNLDVYDTNPGDLGYAQDVAKGGAPYDTCSTAYCHSPGQASDGGPSAPAYATVTWGDTAACGTCHEVNVGSVTSGSHDEHLNATAVNGCGDCHTDAADDASSYNSSSHVDGSIDVANTYSLDGTPGNGYGTCSNIYCHGDYDGSGLNASPTWGTAASGVCGTCHGASNSTVPASGTHLRHAGVIGLQKNYECILCHKDIVIGSGPSSYTIADQSKHLNTKVDWKFDATDSRMAIGTPSYSIATGTAVPTDGTTPRSFGTCSTVYCHSNVQPDGGVGDPDSYAAPTWGTTLNCGACHKQDGSHFVGPVIDSGSHAQHLVNTFTVAFNSNYQKCKLCHKHGSGPIDADDCNSCHNEDAPALHADGTVDVIFYPSFVGGTAAYNDISGTPGEPGNGYFDCSNTYCHSNGTSVSSGTIPGNTSPTWGGTSLACNECHNNPPNYTSGSPKANSHSAHSGFTCNKCHNSTTSDGSTISSTALHINKAYDLNAGGGESFSYTYNAGGGTCNSISCHFNGNATWGGPSLSCTSCHNNGTDDGVLANAAPTTGEHAVHIASNVYVDDCNSCHGANANTGSHTGHSDGSTTTGGDVTSWNGSSCTNNCHLPDPVNWDPVTTLACTNCHNATYLADDPGNSMPTSGLHDLTNAVKHNDTVTGGCEACHTSTPSSAHLDGTDDTSWSTITVSPTGGSFTDGATPTCTATCHSDNANWARLWSADADNTGTTAGSAKCNVCHGQYSSIWNSGTSHEGTFGGSSSIRGDSHNSVTGPANVCEDCHSYPSVGGRHNNGSITMNNPGTGITESGGRAWCSNCHSNDGAPSSSGTHTFKQSVFPLETVNGANNPPANCDACHNGIPQGATYVTRDVFGSDFTQSSRHVYGGTVTNWDCIVCHREGDATAASSGTVGTTSLHGNGGSPVVDMRNVDSINTGWVWDKYNKTDAMHSDMDTFCMSCHDSNGASGINVKATDDGVHLDTTRASKPFNSTDGISSSPTQGGTVWQSAYERTSVLDVYTQFDPNNPSHHAVRGKAYNSHNPNWGDTAWMNKSLKSGQGLMTDYEASTLHCADCHTTDQNAHAGANGFMLEASSIDATCYLCHNATTYSNNSSGDTRWDHSNDGGVWDEAKGSKLGQYGSNGGSICLNCHGGNPVTDGFGGIHGLPSGTDPRSGQERYRFQGGSYMSHDPGSWTGTTGSATCYFAGSTDTQDWSNCTKHDAPETGRTASPQYGRPVPPAP